MKRTTTLVAGAAVAASILTLAAGAASAQAPTDEPALVGDGCVPDARLDQVRTRIERGIDNRLERVDQLQAHEDHLTDAHRSTVDGVLVADETGLTALRARVDAETDGCALADEGRSVVGDFRIYVVVTPQVRLASGADRVTGGEPRLDEIGQHLAEAVDRAEADGRDVTAARAALATYESEVDAAVAAAQPVGDVVLALTPTDWPDPARDTLSSARDDVRAAADHLRAARQAAHDVRDALHDG